MSGALAPLYAATAERRLRAQPRGTVILVQAPFGSGKTELFNARKRSLKTSELTIAVTVSDTAEFDLLNEVRAALPPDARPPAGTLAKTIGRRNVALVLDQVERLTQPAAITLLEDFLLDDPWERTVILFGSSMPDLDWHRIRGVRRILDIGPDELRITSADVERATEGQVVEDRVVDRLLSDTHGWAAAVRAGLARGVADVSAESTRGSGTSSLSRGSADSVPVTHAALEAARQTVDERVVSRFTNEEQAQLLPFAISDAISPTRILGSEATFKDLQQRWRSGSIPLFGPSVRRGGPPTLAPALRDVLLDSAKDRDVDQLEMLVDERIAALRAADEQLALLEVATRHGRIDVVMEQLRESGPHLVFTGALSPVLAALDAVPPTVLAQRADLLALWGAAAGLSGETGSAAHWFDLADAARDADALEWAPDGAGPVKLMRILLGTVQPGTIVVAPDLDPDVPMPWMACRSVLYGFDVGIRGNPTQALGIFSAVAPFTAAYPALELNRPSLLSLTSRVTGRTADAETALAAAERVLGVVGETNVPWLILYALLAERDLKRGVLPSAERRFDLAVQGVRENPLWFRTPRTIAIALLINTARGLGRDQVAEELSAILPELVEDSSEMRGLSTELISQLLQGDLSAAASSDRVRVRLSPVEERVMRQLSTHKPVPQIAQEMHVSTATVRTHIRSIYTKLTPSRAPAGSG